MIPALLGIIAPSFAPIIISVTTDQLVAIPPGASTVDVYAVNPGGRGDAGAGPGVNGNGGFGGNCDWSVANRVAGHTGVYVSVAKDSQPLAFWDTIPPGGILIASAFTNAGGAGGSGAGGVGGGGGAAATEVAVGPGGQLNGGGGVSVVTGSVLAGYVGRGGFNDAAGIGWGAGGGGGTYSGSNIAAFGNPGGILLIFK